MTKITPTNTKEINQLGKDVAVILEKISNIETKVKDIALGLEQKVDCDEFNDIKEKTHKMWDNQNRFIGWLAGIGVLSGAVGGLIVKSISQVLAYYQ